MPSEVRAPRLRVVLDGQELPGALSAEIHSNNHLAADRFRVRLAASAFPQAALHIPQQRVELAVSVNGPLNSLIAGTADSVSFDPVVGAVDIEGRDLSSLLIETQTEETFANRTSSEIVELFAGRHGLQAVVDRTSTPVGRYYQSEHDRITMGQFAKAMTEWDLLASLAAREGFDLYVQGNSLHFQLAAADGAIFLRREDCISLHLEHCVGLGRAIDVTVKSWGSKSGSVVTAAARSSGLEPALKRSITRPNLGSDDAQKLASRLIVDLKRHEWTAAVTMPGELSLSPRSQIVFVGLSAPWDRPFSVTQISRQIDIRRGFTQRLSLQGIP